MIPETKDITQYADKYRIQRDVFKRAVFSGWKGKWPVVLATRHSEKAFYLALEYLLDDPQKVGMVDYIPQDEVQS